MSTTIETIYGWLVQAKERNATHLLVAVDTFALEDYPVYCQTPEEALVAFNDRGGYRGMGQAGCVMEVYDLAMPWTAELTERRARHMPGDPVFPRESEEGGDEYEFS